MLSDERSRKRYDYALAHPEEDIQVHRQSSSRAPVPPKQHSALARASHFEGVQSAKLHKPEAVVFPTLSLKMRTMKLLPLQEEPYGIWKYWRTDARAVVLGFLAVISAIQYFGKRSAYGSVSIMRFEHDLRLKRRRAGLSGRHLCHPVLYQALGV